MKENILKANDIVAGYGDNIIIDGINLEIPPNKISVILGSNGSGKSTMLKTFCRLLAPQSGTIVLNKK